MDKTKMDKGRWVMISKLFNVYAEGAKTNLPVLCFRFLLFKQPDPQCVKCDMGIIQ